MPRRRPSRVRAETKRTPTTTIVGVPYGTSLALDRLDDIELNSAQIKYVLEDWQRVAALSRTELRDPESDMALYIGPQVRKMLERAMQALPLRHAEPLRSVVARADTEFIAKTTLDSNADPSQPWWCRRS